MKRHAFHNLSFLSTS